MKTQNLHNKTLLVGGSTLAAGILAASAAPNTLDVQYPNQQVDAASSISFNADLDPAQFTSTGNEQFTLGNSGGYKFLPETLTTDGLNSGSTGTPAEVTGFLNPGDVVDGTQTFSDEADFSDNDGTYYVGFELNQTDGEHYGYFAVTQSSSPDLFLPTSDISAVLNVISYDELAGMGVTVEAFVPEPGTNSLLAAAALGAVGLALYRRRKQTA